MKLGLLLLILGWVVRCGTSPDEDYRAAQAAAVHQPLPPHRIGPNLHLGMTPDQVQPRLDSVRRALTKNFPLSTSTAPLRPQPVYVAGRLAALVLTLENAGLAAPEDYQSVSNTLLATYGSGSHAHGPLPHAQSWFDGGMEIELWPLPGGDYRVTYADLHQLPQLTTPE